MGWLRARTRRGSETQCPASRYARIAGRLLDRSESRRQKTLCFRKTHLPSGNMTKLGDIVTCQADPGRRFDFLPLQQNAKFLVADLRTFLERDTVRSGEHQSGNHKRNPGCLLSCLGNGEIESARAVLNAFESQIPDVLLRVLFFHSAA